MTGGGRKGVTGEWSKEKRRSTLRFATVSISSESRISVTGQKRSCHVDTWPSTLLRSQSKCLRRRRDDSKADSQTCFSFSLSFSPSFSLFLPRKCSLWKRIYVVYLESCRLSTLSKGIVKMYRYLYIAQSIFTKKCFKNVWL